MSDFLSDVEAAIPNLRRYALTLTRDADAADDLVQDCLERALAKRRLFRPQTTVRAWLFAILHNQFVSDRRRETRRGEHLPLNGPAIEGALVAVDDPLASVALAEVGRALETLSFDQRTALLLVAVEGLTYGEASTVLKVPAGTVMSRIARARRNLASALEANPRLARVK